MKLNRNSHAKGKTGRSVILLLLLISFITLLSLSTYASVTLVDNNGMNDEPLAICTGECYQIYRIDPPEPSFRITALNMEFKYRISEGQQISDTSDSFNLKDIELGLITEQENIVQYTTYVPCGQNVNGTDIDCPEIRNKTVKSHHIEWGDFEPYTMGDDPVYLKITGNLTGNRIDIVPVLEDTPYYQFGWLINGTDCDRRVNFYRDYPSTEYFTGITSKLMINTSDLYVNGWINSTCDGMIFTDTSLNPIDYFIPSCNTAGMTEVFFNSTTNGEGWIYYNCSPMVEMDKQNLDWDDRMLLRYPYAEGFGNAVDMTWDYNATITGGAWYNTTDKRRANHVIYLDGDADYVDRTPIASISPDYAFTVSAWFYANETTGGTDYYTIFGTNTDGTDRINFGLRKGTVNGGMYNGGWASTPCGGNFCNITTAIQKGVWYHLAIVNHQFDNYDIYLNGIQETLNPGEFANSGDQHLTWGATKDTGFRHYFNGSIDDTMVFTYNMSVAEVKALFHMGNRTLNVTPELAPPDAVDSEEFSGIICGEKYPHLWVNLSYTLNFTTPCVLRDNEYLFNSYSNCSISNQNITGFFGHNRLTIEYPNHTTISQCDVWLVEKEMSIADYLYYFFYVAVILVLILVSVIYNVPALQMFAGIATVFMSFVFYTVSYLVAVVFLILGILLIVLSWMKFGTPSKVFTGR